MVKFLKLTCNLLAIFPVFCWLTPSILGCTPQLKAFQDRSSLACMKCEEVTLSNVCEYDSVLVGGSCGSSTVQYSLAESGCARATIECNSKRNRGVLIGASTTRQDNFTEDQITLFSKNGAASAHFDLLCGDDSKWTYNEATTGAVPLANPVVLHCIDGAEQTENLPQIKAPSLNIKSLNTTTDLIQDIAKIVGTSASSIIGSVGAVSDAIGSTGRITDTGINGHNAERSTQQNDTELSSSK
ncbi:hypothetical protein DdX_04772 [Ditylenchus destructor]|uniref:Cyanovirin-N domain-containing protein n=1 Tax=Ditylenchus destructor TaxID=166010 RepID=A0AAD4RAA5_9BILA|nr:hypothetical protein DdX_04772 [Ditylenchus destructor]